LVPPIAWKADAGPLVTVGDVAPDFSVPAFDGSTLRLSDYRGKFVLIDFWATWCGPCVEEMPNLIAAYRQFAPTGKVEFISLSLDGEPDAPLAFVEREKIEWKQGFLGEWSEDPVTKAYDVGGIPSVFLIGPDGKVLERGLRGEDIAAAIGKALAEKSPAAPASAPAR
jgi:peroxiredoxin